jgi:hypothetical protein
MAGRHHKRSRARTAAGKRGSGVAAAALGVAGISTAIGGGVTAAVMPEAQLMALITPSNSTSQFFAGTTYYGTNWTDVYGPQQTVPFLAGPNGIANAISSHKNDQEPTGVVASGWGAGQTGTALAGMSPADKSNVAFVILDNNTNRPGGGFWTTYGLFAPLLLTSSAPTPSNLGVPTLDVAYEYNINSDAPVDPLNPFALGNSLAAYAYGYGGQSNAVIPKSIMDEAQSTNPNTQHYAYVLDSHGNIISQKKVSGTTTYVTIESDNLPLTRPLRLLPGGDIVADAIDPTMTQLVDAGYNDGKGMPGDPAIPADPTVTRPMQPGSSLTGLGGVPGSIPNGLQDGVQTAGDDLSNPTNFLTKPLGEAGSLPGISSVNPSALTNQSVSSNTLNAGDPNKFLPNLLPGTGNNAPNGAPSGGNVVKTVADKVGDTVNKVTGALSGK